MRGSRLGPLGLGLVGAGLALVAAAFLAGQPDLLTPGLFLVVLPLLALASTVVLRPRLAVGRRLVPEVVQVDAPARVELDVARTDRLGVGPLVATDEPPRAVGAGHRFLVPAAARLAPAREAYVRTPRRRGRWAMGPLRYESTDALGLAHRSSRADAPGVLVVTPRVLPLAHANSSGFGRQGETPIPQAAVSGPDDVLVREYQARDDMRRIHWPSTARTGTLMVRREEQAWDPTAWIVLDSRAIAHPGGRGEAIPTFEWLLTEVASVGSVLLDDGFEVSVADASGDSFTVSATRDQGAHTQLLEHLVDAELADQGTLRLAARTVARAPAGHLVVALLARLDEETARHLVATHDGQQLCRALALPQPGATLAFAAGRSVLVDHGWSVVECPVDGDLAGAWAASGSASGSAGWR